jgi:outer membrane biosynthesis protein TonB
MSPPAAADAAPAAQAPARSNLPPKKALAGKERGAGIGAATSTGGHVNDLAKAVAGMAPAFTRCYDIGLGQDPKMAGSVRVTIKIGPKGEVISAAPAGGDGLSAEVIACVIHVVQAARFSPPEGGSATITIPLTMG